MVPPSPTNPFSEPVFAHKAGKKAGYLEGNEGRIEPPQLSWDSGKR